MKVFTVLKNDQLSKKHINDIVLLKQQHWNYPVESQIRWLKDNIRDDDSHLLFYDESRLIAYLNLVKIEIDIDGLKFHAKGIGNVCVDKELHGQGLGNKIVVKANEILLETNYKGFLLCHPQLVNFYLKAGWKEIICDHIVVENVNYTNKIMVYNSDIVFANTMYLDRNF